MGKSKKKRNEKYKMIDGTLFQFYIDLEDCDGSYSKLAITDAKPEVIDQIASELRMDKKLTPCEQEKAILNIIKTRGYTVDVVKRKVITIQALD